MLINKRANASSIRGRQIVRSVFPFTSVFVRESASLCQSLEHHLLNISVSSTPPLLREECSVGHLLNFNSREKKPGWLVAIRLFVLLTFVSIAISLPNKDINKGPSHAKLTGSFDTCIHYRISDRALSKAKGASPMVSEASKHRTKDIRSELTGVWFGTCFEPIHKSSGIIMGFLCTTVKWTQMPRNEVRNITWRSPEGLKKVSEMPRCSRTRIDYNLI